LEQIKRNVNNNDFAKFFGITQHKLTKWKSGMYNFSIYELVYIFDKLDISLYQLFNELNHAERVIDNDKSTN
jgi:hypothetical protein